MATARAKKPPPRAPSAGYFAWSRDPAMSLFAVLPLWLLYEGLRLLLAPAERNGAEVLVGESLRALGPHAITMMRLVVACTVLGAAWSLHRRDVPWVRVAAVIALEGAVYGLMLGPTASALAASSPRLLIGVPAGRLAADLVASIGAGLFEELVFRLALVSILTLLLTRPCEVAHLPRTTAAVLAVVGAAFVFSLFHHVGPGAPPIERTVFVFRVAAGLLLGFLFVVRGFGVAVYTHALYDIHYYLTHHA
ncbi:MAG: CPBP family glutamic-type intramembrane protease [Planctomycetota bacterium]